MSCMKNQFWTVIFDFEIGPLIILNLLMHNVPEWSDTHGMLSA